MSETPLDDILFWSRQLSEHALFMQLGLELEPYKSQASALHKDWETARGKLVGASFDQAKAIVAKPTTDLRAFKVAVYDKIKGGTWCGWLFPLFVDHTRRELDYFTQRVWYGGYDSCTTATLNIAFMREHAMFAASLLDPSEGALIRAALGIAGEFQRIGACSSVSEQFKALTLKAGQDLDTYFTTQPVSAAAGRSVIHPVLADHVVREGRRMLATMQALPVSC